MTNRSYGQGGYQQREDGSWRWRGMVAGRRRSLSHKHKRELEKRVRKLLGDADQGIMPPEKCVTVKQYITGWLEDTVKQSVRPATYTSYNTLARHYLIPAFGTVKLTDLQPAHLRKLYGEMRSNGLSPSTVQRVHAVIRRALKQAVEDGLIPRSIATAVRQPRSERPEISPYSPVEVRQLQSVAKGTRWEALINLALATGMRQGELLGLKWGDVDLETGTVQVRRQLTRDLVFADPKTAHGRRTINIGKNTMALLREHKRCQNEQRLLLGAEWEQREEYRSLVFTTEFGRPLGTSTLTRNYKELLKKAGLPERRFHDLRHTAATLMLLNGEHPKVVQTRLGHSTIQMTIDLYSHAMPSMDREAADRLDTLLA